MDTQKQATMELSTRENELAEKLFNAYQSHNALKESDYKGVVTDEDAAYRVQKRLTELKNEEVGGYKVSLTSKQTQDMFDSDSPLYGAQVKSHFVQSPVTLHRAQLMEPLAEVEMLFTAKEDLSSKDSLEDLLRKTKVAPAVEVLIHDSATGSQACPNTWLWRMQLLAATLFTAKKLMLIAYLIALMHWQRSSANYSTMVRS